MYIYIIIYIIYIYIYYNMIIRSQVFLHGELSWQMTCSILHSEPSPSGAPIQNDATWALLLGLLLGIF